MDITDIVCPRDGVITFSFSNPDHFKLAMKTWPKKGEDFVMIDNTDGCGKPGSRTFFYVDTYEMDKKTHSVRAEGEMLDGNHHKITQGMRIHWAHNRPAEPHSTSNPSLDQRWWDPITTRIADIVPQPTGVAKLAERWGFGDLTSEVGGAFSEATSGAASVADAATSEAASVVSSVTSEAASVVTSATSEAASVANDATSAAGDLASEASAKATSVAGDVISHLPSTHWSKDFTHRMHSATSQDDDTPWGQKGKKFPTIGGVTTYCLDCRMEGTLSMGGEVEFRKTDVPEDYVQEAKFHLYLDDFTVALIVGMDFQDVSSPNIPALHVLLEDIPLQPVAIPEVFDLGPQVNELADIDLALSATGRLKTGGSFHWDKAEAHVDLMQDDKVNATGWEPKTKHVYEPSEDAEITLNATITVPTSTGAGLNMLAGVLNKQVKVEFYPGVKLIMTTKAKWGERKRGYRHNYREHARDLIPRELRRKDEAQCPGVGLALNMYMRGNGGVDGLYNDDFYSTESPIASTCLSTAASDKSGIPGGSAVAAAVNIPTLDSALDSISMPIPTGEAASSVFASFSTTGAGTDPTAGASADSGAPTPTGKR